MQTKYAAPSVRQEKLKNEADALRKEKLELLKVKNVTDLPANFP